MHLVIDRPAQTVFEVELECDCLDFDLDLDLDFDFDFLLDCDCDCDLAELEDGRAVRDETSETSFRIT